MFGQEVNFTIFYSLCANQCFWFIWSYFMLYSFVLLWYENTCSIYFDSVLISVHCRLSLLFVPTCEFGTERFCLEALKRHTFNVWPPIYYVLKSRTSGLEDLEKRINPVLIQTPDRTCKVPAHKNACFDCSSFTSLKGTDCWLNLKSAFLFSQQSDPSFGTADVQSRIMTLHRNRWSSLNIYDKLNSRSRQGADLTFNQEDRQHRWEVWKPVCNFLPCLSPTMTEK